MCIFEVSKSDYMRKVLTSLVAAAVLVIMGSCSTKVDLYDDYQDIAIVYGLLDYKLDTNYVRIEKAFLGYGNALEIAQNPDSCNYPGKLEAKLVEVMSEKVFYLDTITIHHKDTGVFYGNDQKVYYTTATINPLSRYKLEITKPDGTLVSATTNIVGGESFKIVRPGSYNFSSNATKANVTWFPADNAALYEVQIGFDWEENGERRVMSIPLGTHLVSNISVDHGQLKLPFSPALFFNSLETFLGDDTLKTVERRYHRDCITISISAGGSELATYIEANSPSSSIAQSTMDWTNVKNGYGVFSSRVNIQEKTALSSPTITELIQRGWGFVKID